MLSARQAAVSTLLKTVQSRGYSNIELDTAIKKYELTGVERSFFTALFYGVIERKITLDYIISAISSRKIEDIDVKVMTILECGVYQLRYMDKVPESAAVNESVKLCEKFYTPKNSEAFVNAVLRGYIRKKDEIAFPDKKKEMIKYLSITYSVPEWICSLWVRELGFSECEKLLDSISLTPKMTVRTNTLKTDEAALIAEFEKLGVMAKRTRFAPHGVRLLGPAPMEIISKIDGLFFVQDEASQLASAALGAKEGDTVIDVCACPGGKSFSAALDMNDRGRVLSFDLHKNKLGLISEAAKKLGISIIETNVQNGTVPRPDMPKSDKVICDVPCSGLGVIAKKPDIRHKGEDEIKDLPALQKKILDVASSYVCAGGDIVYSTCTLRKAENEDVINDFLNTHKDFSLCPFDAGTLHSSGMITLYPHVHKTDGFFISKLHRNK